MYKRLTSTIQKLTPHTVKLHKGASLRRIGVSFKFAADKENAKKRDDANTPGTSRREGSKNAGKGRKQKRRQNVHRWSKRT